VNTKYYKSYFEKAELTQISAARLLIGDHGAIRDGAHGCRGYGKGPRE
jgi:hypothetical protein